MTDDYKFIFNYNSGNKVLIYQNNKTIKSLLERFLTETNSKMVLAHDEIQFIYNSKILNTDDGLKKNINELFKPKIIKGQKVFLFTIKVLETSNIIGGINILIN